MVSLLGRVAQILPESTALLSFRADSVGGNFVLLTTSGTEILPEISRADGLESADLVGNVASQSFGTARLQRMMVRYRFADRRNTGAKARP